MFYWKSSAEKILTILQWLTLAIDLNKVVERDDIHNVKNFEAYASGTYHSSSY